MAGIDDKLRLEAKQVIKSEIGTVSENTAVIKDNGCAACHVLFKMTRTLGISEQDAADLLSEILLDDASLNDQFISLIETIHMKGRMMGTTFVIKTREAKDRYIDANFKNVLNELLNDASVNGAEIVIRRLILSNIALNIAQNLGTDYHAAMEELYYYMRKNDQDTNQELMQAIRSILMKIGRQEP